MASAVPVQRPGGQPQPQRLRALAERAAGQGSRAVALQQQPGQGGAGGDAMAAGQVRAPRLEVRVDVERRLRRRHARARRRHRYRPRRGRPRRARRGCGETRTAICFRFVEGYGRSLLYRARRAPTRSRCRHRAAGSRSHRPSGPSGIRATPRRQPPSAQALAQRRGDHGPLRGHGRGAEHRGGGVVHQVAVDLVGDDDQVVLGGLPRTTPATVAGRAAGRSGCRAA